MKYIFIFFLFNLNLLAYENAIFDITDLNSDSSNDTIVLNSTNGFLSIDKINWGSSSFTTNFEYPDLFYIKNYFWNFDVNKDGLKDIVILSSGKLDTTEYKDTAYFKIVYGQSGLESIDTVKISEIDTLQFTPYVASTISANSGVSQGKIQSLSSIPVFELYFNNLNTQDTTTQKKTFNYQEDILIARYNLFPNPAYYYSNLELIDIKEGEYSIEIRKLDSYLMDDFKLDITNRTTITQYLDLKEYPTGTYIIVIKSKNLIIKNIKLVVIK